MGGEVGAGRWEIFCPTTRSEPRGDGHDQRAQPDQHQPKPHHEVGSKGQAG